MNEIEKRIKRYNDFQEEMKKRKPNKNAKIRLGDRVTIGENKPAKGKRTYDLWVNYRCVGINPEVQLQEVRHLPGNEEELGEIITLTTEQEQKAEPIKSFFEPDAEITSWKIEKKDLK